MKKASGRSFEIEIADLLSLSDCEISGEQIVGHKKIDILLTQKRLGTSRRIAVECKDYSKRLTKTQVAAIYSHYNPLYRSGKIDETLIVTRHGLTAGAETLVKDSRDLTHMTAAEVLDMIMGLEAQTRGLVKLFENEGLPSYYIPRKDASGHDLEKKVSKWMLTTRARPLAILGSYGVGKTTFAKRMCHVLARRALGEYGERIPILIPLGEISSEQSLEGLLGKIFTAQNTVANYSFNLFMALNRMGRLIIVLDGFDEMRQTLALDAFWHNFKQINRLVTPESRIVLLGRPTAFLNDEEHSRALGGVRLVNKTPVREPAWPEYREITLAPFSWKETRQFVRLYMEYKLTESGPEHESNALKTTIEKRVEEVCGARFADVARRPIQTKILVEVLPSWQVSIEDLTVSRLYSHFIDLMIERELAKLGRKRFSLQERRRFARDIAVFLWKKKQEMKIVPTDIPSSIIEKFCNSSDDPEAVRRDLVAACFLDRGLDKKLSFPHRSFQEFLVAEFVLEGLEGKELTLYDANSLVNAEIGEFMAGLLDENGLISLELSLTNYKGRLSVDLAGVFISREEFLPHLYDRLTESSSPWYPILLTLAARLRQHDPLFYDELDAFLLEDLMKTRGRETVVYFICILCLSRDSKVALSSLGKMMELARTELFSPQRRGVLAEREFLLHKFLRNIRVTGGRIELASMHAEMFRELSDYCLITDGADAGTLSSRLGIMDEFFVDQYSGSKLQDKLRSLRDLHLSRSRLYHEPAPKRYTA